MWSWLERRRELDNEIEGHLELAVRELVARGMTPKEARAHARRNFGNLTLIREEARDAAGWPMLASAVQDLRHAWRRLYARPATAVFAVALLALAIGMTSAMFTIVDALLLRPAPFRDPATLAMLGAGTTVNLPFPLIKAWRGSPAFAAVHAVRQQPATFGTGEDAQAEGGARVTAGLFEELGVTPLLGRTFVPGEGGPGADDIALISETIWRTRFGADPSLVGTRVEMSGAPVLIVGVMPASFTFPYARTRVWRPIDLDRLPPDLSTPRATAYAYARLAPGMPRADVVRLATAAANDLDPGARDRGVVLRPLAAGHLDAYSAGTVKVGAVSVGLVFLVLCVNVTNLMLARISARRREFALCTALGASRGRLLRQALWEQILIGGAAAALGLAAGAALVALARTYLPGTILRGSLNPLDLDLRAVLATSVVSGLALVVAGVLPAWIGTSHDASPQLQLTSRGSTAERTTRRTTTWLLVAELALAVALSVGAGIQLRSFVSLLHEERGIDAERLSTFTITFPAARFADGASRYAAAEQVRASVQSLPGVERSAISFGVPPGSGSIYFGDIVPDVRDAPPVNVTMNGYDVTPEFFAVYGIRLLDGRVFERGDPADAAIISRSMAAALWPNTSAVGRSFSHGKRTRRVIGVVSDIRNPLLDPRNDEPEIYDPLLPSHNASAASATASAGASAGAAANARAAGPSLAGTLVYLTIRCGDNCPTLETTRARIRSAGAGAFVSPGKRVSDDYSAALERPRAGAVLAFAFAAIALLAVGAGLFAVLTRVAQQRQREFGIRLALGATPADVRRLVHTNSLVIATLGIGAGVVLAWTLGRVLASVQHQVRLADPLTWTIVIGVIGATALAAAWRPGRQAMRVDPVTLLRDE